MGDGKKDAMDSLLEFILADDTPVGPEDAESLRLFQKATEDAEVRVAKARLQRARAFWRIIHLIFTVGNSYTGWLTGSRSSNPDL